jgi:vitamin B12 transporter
MTTVRAVLALALTLPVIARAQMPRDTTRRQTLPTVTTTGSRYPTAPRETPRVIEVIDRATIDATAAMDVPDLLKKRAAIDVVQYPGLLGGIGIRGFRPQVGTLQQRTLILIDGRPSGVTNAGLLDIQDVERIEVIKGAASALYGSTAMGGVVNIVTRARRNALTGTLQLMGGSFGTSELRAQGGGRLGLGFDGDLSVRRLDQRNDFRIGAGGVLGDAFSRETARKIYPPGGGTNRDVADTIGGGATRGFTSQRLTSGTARVGRRIGGGLRLDARSDVAIANDVPTPGDIYSAGTPFPGDGRKDVSRIGSAIELTGASGRHAPTIRLHTTDDRSGFYDRPDSVRFVSFRSINRTDGAQVQDVLTLGAQQLVLGADVTRFRATSDRFSALRTAAPTFSPNASTLSTALFAETQLRALDGRLTAMLGGRFDRVRVSLDETALRTDVRPGDDTFTAFNPSAGLQYRVASGVRLHASGGRGFIAPDAFGRAGLVQALSGGAAAITVGNPDLRAESSITTDVGASITRLNGALDLDVTYFHTDVSDRITRASASFTTPARPLLPDNTPVSRVTTSINAGDASIRGLEASARYDLGAALQRSWGLTLTSALTHMLRAEESVRSITVDAARFTGVTQFNPVTVASAVTLGAATTTRIRNIASTTLNLGVDWDDRTRLRAGALLRYVGTRLDEDFSDFADISDIEYPPMATLDLTVGLRLSRQFRLDAVVSNVTDENVYEKRGYNLPGRAFQLRLSVQP